MLSAESQPTAGGVPPSLAEGTVTDLDAIAGAFPATFGDWTRGPTTAMPRGAAGHWSPVVVASYRNADATILGEVNDFVHVCTCAAGMGGVLRARERERSGGEERELHGHPALRFETPPQLLFWVNDRCTVRLAGGPSTTLLEEFAETIDWAALGGACPRR